MKQPRNATQPFPWRCNHCGEKAVDMATIEYEAEVRHDGRLYSFTVPNLRIPTCGACGEGVFTDEVDRQINDALRVHLQVFTPSQIRSALDRVGLSQKEAAERLGIAEATLSRWLNETQIQAKSLDRYIRVFFAFPQVREALCGESLDHEFGTRDIVSDGATVASERTNRLANRGRRPNSGNRWGLDANRMRVSCSQAQRIVVTAGSTWGERTAR